MRPLIISKRGGFQPVKRSKGKPGGQRAGIRTEYLAPQALYISPAEYFSSPCDVSQRGRDYSYQKDLVISARAGQSAVVTIEEIEQVVIMKFGCQEEHGQDVGRMKAAQPQPFKPGLLGR